MISNREIYEAYLALKFHFTQEKWSYKKYGGHVGSNAMKSYNENRLGFACQHIARTYGNRYRGFFLANNIEEPGFWIQKEGTHEIYLQWLGRTEGFTYLFSEAIIDLEALMTQRNVEFDDLIKVEAGRFPALFRMIIGGQLNPEIACSLTNGLKLWDRWDYDMWLSQQPMYKAERLKLQKYAEFCNPGRIFEQPYMNMLATLFQIKRVNPINQGDKNVICKYEEEPSKLVRKSGQDSREVNLEGFF